MGLIIELDAKSHAANRRLQELLEELNDPDLQKQVSGAIGYAAQLQVQAHLRNVDSKRSGTQMPGARSGYYGRAATLTSTETDSKEARVRIAQPGIGLHYYGGTVRPKRAKALTIPAIPAAYGKRAGEFPDLDLVVFGRKGTGKKGKAALVRKRGEALQVVYWLVKKTTHTADKTILPTDEALLDQATSTVQRIIERLEKQKGVGQDGQ